MPRALAVLSVVLTTVLAASTATAGEDGESSILVTARRLPTSRAESGPSITAISSEDIEVRQPTSLSDVLREVPGLWVTRAGGHGSPTSFFVRGTATTQVKVLLDGFALNDPTLGGQYNAYDLVPDGLDRVEVLRGSQSTLYGSEAIGGVIQLVSRSYRGPLSVRLVAEGGSRLTARGKVEVGGGDEVISGGIFASYVRTDNATHDNAYAGTTLGGRLTWRPAEEFTLGVTLRFVDSEAEEPFDLGDPLPRDRNIDRARRTVLAGLNLTWSPCDGVTLKAQGARMVVDSDLINGPDAPGDPEELRSESTGRVDEVSLSAIVEPLRLAGAPGDAIRDRLLVGLEYQEEDSRNETSSAFGATRISEAVRDRSLFAQEELTLFERVTATLGGRFTDNDVFGCEATPSYALQYRHPETSTVISARYTMGFRAPTPLEFADPWFGNADLTEEKSRSFDIGVRQSLLEGDLVAEATWFSLAVDDLIAYDPATLRLENFRRTRTTGLELSAAWRIDDRWSVGGAFTAQDPKDLDAAADAEDQLPNRPRRFGSLWLRFECAGLDVLTTAILSGGFPDTGIVGPDSSARSHPGRKTLLNLAASYRLSSTCRLFGRIENLLDDTYVETERAPRAPGFGLHVGCELTF